MRYFGNRICVQQNHALPSRSAGIIVRGPTGAPSINDRAGAGGSCTKPMAALQNATESALALILALVRMSHKVVSALRVTEYVKHDFKNKLYKFDTNML